MMAGYGFLDRETTIRARRLGSVVMEASWEFRAAHTTVSLVEEELELLVRGSGYTGYVNVLYGTDVIVIHMLSTTGKK